MAINIITEKRLKNEIKKIQKERLEFAQAIPDENNKFLFYFLLKGDEKSDYNGGYYIGKIELPKNYPTSPGDFYMLTKNGRFDINHKICLSNTAYHSDTWSPSWDIINMLIGFVSVFNDDTEHGISHIKESSEQRKLYAKESVNYNLLTYPDIFKRFDQFVNKDGIIKTEADKLIVDKTEANKIEYIVDKITTNEIKIKENTKRIIELIDIIRHTTYENYNKTYFDEYLNLLEDNNKNILFNNNIFKYKIKNL